MTPVSALSTSRLVSIARELARTHREDTWEALARRYDELTTEPGQEMVEGEAGAVIQDAPLAEVFAARRPWR